MQPFGVMKRRIDTLSDQSDGEGRPDRFDLLCAPCDCSHKRAARHPGKCQDSCFAAFAAGTVREWVDRERAAFRELHKLDQYRMVGRAIPKMLLNSRDDVSV